MVADKTLSPLPGLINATSYPGACAPGYHLSAPPGLGPHMLQPSFPTDTGQGSCPPRIHATAGVLTAVRVRLSGPNPASTFSSRMSMEVVNNSALHILPHPSTIRHWIAADIPGLSRPRRRRPLAPSVLCATFSTARVKYGNRFRMRAAADFEVDICR